MHTDKSTNHLRLSVSICGEIFIVISAVEAWYPFYKSEEGLCILMP